MLVVDSSILVEYLRDNPRAVKFLERRHETDEIIVPTLVAWELWKGATTPSRKQQVSDLLSALSADPFTSGIAQLAGELHIQQQSLGRSRPVIDLLIAAHALQHRCPVATLDRDYQGVPGLMVEKGA